MIRLAALALLLPATAHAADGATQIWEALNLVLLFSVLFFVARKPVLEYLSGRKADITSNIESSEKLLGEAEARLSEWNQKAAQLDEEVAMIRAATKKAAETERDHIIADAQATAERIKAGASAVVDRELNVARESLREEVAVLATDLAATILQEKVNDGDRSRLVDEFIQKIEQGGSH